MTEATATVPGKIATIGYGADGTTPGNTLRRISFERDAPKSNEVLIDVLYCGVCHSDVHLLDDSWKATLYPCVPGHELVGRVKYAGDDVTKFKVGDLVGSGCMIDSCALVQLALKENCPSMIGPFRQKHLSSPRGKLT